MVETGKKHRGWHYRGYLPHFDASDVIQMITFRLHDSLPKDVLKQLRVDSIKIPDSKRRILLDRILDKGYGACYLKDHRIAKLVENAFKYFDGIRYRLIAWVIMSNHIHTLIKVYDRFPLEEIIHSWKSYTAHEINKTLKRQGPIWFPDYWDRYIRDEKHFLNAVEYIHNNPVKAGLVDDAVDYKFSSASEWKNASILEKMVHQHEGSIHINLDSNP